jgi:hypothetical protein
MPNWSLKQHRCTFRMKHSRGKNWSLKQHKCTFRMKHSHKKPKVMFQSAVSKEANSLQESQTTFLMGRKANNFAVTIKRWFHPKENKRENVRQEVTMRRDKIGSKSISVPSDPQKIIWHTFTLFLFSRESWSLLWIVSGPRGVA